MNLDLIKLMTTLNELKQMGVEFVSLRDIDTSTAGWENIKGLLVFLG